MSADVDALRATLEETRAKLEAALDAREAATRARNEAESAWLTARDAVRANDPIYDALAQAMVAADMDSHAYDHDDWCNRVDRLRAAFAQGGFDIVARPHQIPQRLREPVRSAPRARQLGHRPSGAVPGHRLRLQR